MEYLQAAQGTAGITRYPILEPPPVALVLEPNPQRTRRPALSAAATALWLLVLGSRHLNWQRPQWAPAFWGTPRALTAQRTHC